MLSLYDRSEIKYDGDKISSVSIQWGREKRPLWKTLENLPIQTAVKWCDRFSPFEALAAEWSFARSFEVMYGLQVPKRAEILRSIYSEVQRLLWSFDYLTNLFCALGDSIRYQHALRLREQVLEGQEVLTGSRVLPQILCVGGIERDMSAGEKKKLKGLVRQLEYEMRYFFKDLPQDRFVMGRLAGLMVVSERTAKAISLLGVFGQASGLPFDLRIDNPYGGYQDLSIQIFDCERTVDWFDQSAAPAVKGDGLNRLRSVFFQIRQSLNLIDTMIDRIEDGPVRVEFNSSVRPQEGFWINGVEGGSGPLYAIMKNGQIRLYSHSMRMVSNVEFLFSGLRSDDFDLAFASLGIDFLQADLC